MIWELWFFWPMYLQYSGKCIEFLLCFGFGIKIVHHHRQTKSFTSIVAQWWYCKVGMKSTILFSVNVPSQLKDQIEAISGRWQEA